MKKTIYLSLLALLAALNLSAQAKTQAPVQVWRITAQEAELLRQDGQEVLGHAFFHSYVDTLSPSRAWPTGHYLWVHPQGEHLQVSLHSINAHQAHLLGKGRELLLRISDAKGRPVAGAKVRVGKHVLDYHAPAQAYRLRKRLRKSAPVRIELPGDTLLYQVSEFDDHRRGYKPLKPWAWRARQYDGAVRAVAYPYFYLRHQVVTKPQAKRQYRQQQRQKINGYLALNQPRYRPGDTLRFSAYVTDAKGRPISQAFSLYLQEPGNAKKILAQTHTPSVAGMVTGHWPLPKDSLKLNKTYALVVQPLGRERRHMQQTFRYEDYQLREASYTLSTSATSFQAGDTIALTAAGKDANDLYLTDARVKIVLLATDISDCYLPLLRIPDKLWVHETALLPGAPTSIVVPDSLLPPCSARWTAKAFFANSNGELHERSTSLKYTRTPLALAFRLDADTLVVEALRHGRSAPMAATLYTDITAPAKDTEGKAVTLPWREPVNPLAYRYRAQAAGVAGWAYLSEGNWIVWRDPETPDLGSVLDAGVSLSGALVGDTLQVAIQNPHRLTISWWAQSSQGTLEEGSTNSESFWRAIPNAGYRDYVIKAGYLWGGTSEELKATALQYKNRLQVSLVQAPRVVPGEEAMIELQVTDYKQRPVQNVRLAASAVNAQFGGNMAFRSPEIAYRAPTKLLQQQGYKLYDNPTPNFQLAMDSTWYQRMALEANLFYRLRYSGQGAVFHYDTVATGSPKPAPPQFAPHIIRQGKAQGVYLIYCNRELVYYYGASEDPPYSFVGRAGYNSITVRTREREYTIDSVWLKPGWKLDFSIDEDYFGRSGRPIKVKAAPTSLTGAEKKLLDQSIFVLRNPAARAYTYVMDERSQQIHRATGYVKPFITGPFKPNTLLKYHVQGGMITEVRFEPGFSYEVVRQRERLYKHDLFAPEKNVPLPASLPVKMPAQRVLTRHDITPLPQAAPRSPRSLYKDKNITMRDRGRYRFKYTPTHDSLQLQHLVLEKNDSLQAVYDGDNRTLSMLSPGEYKLLFFIGSRSVHERALRIAPHETLFEDLQDISLVRNDSLWLKYNFITRAESRQLDDNPFKNNGYLISGRLLEENGEPLMFGTVTLHVDGKLVSGTESNFEGYYELWVPKGPYELGFSYVGYTSYRVVNLGPAGAGNVTLGRSGVLLDEVVVKEYKVPLIHQDNTTQGQTISADQIHNLPTRDISALQAKVSGVLIQEDHLDLRGSRSEATEYYVDGIRVSGGLADALATLGTGRIRSDFRDNAWWQPDLLTDREGKAYFRVRYPDDITAWESFAVGQDKRQRAGVGFGLVKAYQPLAAQLATPRFFLAGDRGTVVGKALNYTGDTVQVQTYLSYGDSVAHRNTLQVAEGTNEKIPLLAPMGTDSLHLTYAMTLGGFTDGERRSVPVFPRGVRETTGHFFVIAGDTSITVATDPQLGPVTLHAQGDMLDIMLDEVDKLASYPYGCNEQTASRLLALLLDKEIRAYTGQPFAHEEGIRQALALLQERQNPQGNWGWWGNGTPVNWITRYVLRALHRAEANGYPSPALETGLRLLTSQLDTLQGRDLLEGLCLLSDVRQPADYERYLTTLDTLHWPLLHRLQLISLRQAQQLPYSLDSLHHYAQRTVFGGQYWGEGRYHLHYNTTQPTLEAYRILRRAGDAKALQAIRQYFLMSKDNKYGLGWRNTYETASILATLLPDMTSHLQGAAPSRATLLVKGQPDSAITQFPYTVQRPAGEPIQFQKSGTGPLFVTTYQAAHNERPAPKADVFRVHTRLEQDGRPVQQLRQGEKAVLVVEIAVDALSEYVLIEAPIPAGCSYAEGQGRQRHEVHREYLRQHAALFCERLPPGKHRFEIVLEPRFSGTYTLNPARAELMYFPVFYGHNELREVVVE